MDEWIGFGVGERARESGGYDRCSNVWKMPLQIKTRVVAVGTVLFQFTPLLTLGLGTLCSKLAMAERQSMVLMD